MPKIDLFDVCYVRLGTRDLDGAARYMTDIIGLDPAGRERKAAHFKSDHRHHTIVWLEGDPADQTFGIELRNPKDLDKVAGVLDDIGFRVHAGTKEECEQRRCRDFINFKDPSGNSIDIVARPWHSGVPYHGTRNAGITGFNHVGLRTNDPVRDIEFWTEVCSARVSDYIAESALLRIATGHHSIAMFPSKSSGIQHINHQVESIDDVMRSYYFLRERDVPIVWGPGRHLASTAMFVYFRGPEGMTFEYSSGLRHIMPEEEASYRPRHLPWEPLSLCYWGSSPEGIVATINDEKPHKRPLAAV